MRRTSRKRPLSLAVRTSPSHGENTSSILVGVTTRFQWLRSQSHVADRNFSTFYLLSTVDALGRPDTVRRSKGQNGQAGLTLPRIKLPKLIDYLFLLC